MPHCDRVHVEATMQEIIAAGAAEKVVVIGNALGAYVDRSLHAAVEGDVPTAFQPVPKRRRKKDRDKPPSPREVPFVEALLGHAVEVPLAPFPAQPDAFNDLALITLAASSAALLKDGAPAPPPRCC